MNESSLKQVVAQWLDEPLPDLVPREVAIPDLTQLRSVLAIVGPRRAGKTMFMYQQVRDLESRRGNSRLDILFVDFEDYRLLGMAPSDMASLLAAFEQLAGQAPKYLFFDEVQQLPEWSRVLRTLHNQRKYRIVVSGSNSRLLARETATELRGRYQDVLMLPFSYREALVAKGIHVTSRSLHTAERGRLVAAFDEYLATGGFPEVMEAGSAADRRRLLQSYFRTIFYRDIVDRYNVRAKHVLETMMDYCLGVYGDLFSVSRFEKHLRSADLPASKRTIANYLRYLEEAFFVVLNQKFSPSPRKRIMNPKKLYLVDTGFAALSEELSENRGKVLENIVALELVRRGVEAYYYRGSRECDCVIVRNRKPVTAIQVCWELTPRNRARELRGLTEAMDALGVGDGVVLTHHQHEDIVVGGRSVPVRPVYEWLLAESR